MSDSLPSENVVFKTLEEIVSEVQKEMRCYCDLDRWEPNRDTWHSKVCPIDKTARARFAAQRSKAQREMEAFCRE